MSDSRRHHIVPLMIQRRFLDEDGFIAYFDKRRPHLGVLRVNPINAFVERDLNSTVTNEGVRDASLEREFAELESEAKVVTDRILEAAQRRKIPRLSPDERLLWDTFFYIQQKRAPDVFQRLGFVDVLKNDLSSYLDEYERNVRPLTEVAREWFQQPETMARLIQNVTVKARSGCGEEVIAVLAKRGLAVAAIQDPKKSFILGDHPLARFNGRLDDPKNEVWMPIAPDVAVSPWQTRDRGEICTDISTENIRLINRTIFDNSNVVASRSEVLLRSLAGLC